MTLPKLVNMAYTPTILSALATSACSASSFNDLTTLSGIIPCRMANLFFNRPITRSTSDRDVYSDRDVSTSWAENWSRPLMNAGVNNYTPAIHANSSFIVKPRSANIWSLGWCGSLVRNSLLLTSSMSLTRPPPPSSGEEINRSKRITRY